MELVHRGIWSPETEAICRGVATIFTLLTKKKNVPWTAFLPEQYMHSASLPDIPDTEQATRIRRNLSKQLDGLVKQYAKRK